MGRKPNQLLLEFFERGAKIDDSSNRYHHTCKACGQQFPKGRSDHLTLHLLKNCTEISAQDRQRAMDEMSQTPNQHGSFNTVATAIRSEQAERSHTDSTTSTSGNMSALETLAEVSRQQLGSNNGGAGGAASDGRKDSRKRKRSGEVEWNVNFPHGTRAGTHDGQRHEAGNDLSPDERLFREIQAFNDAGPDASSQTSLEAQELASRVTSQLMSGPTDHQASQALSQQIDPQLQDPTGALANHAMVETTSPQSRLKPLLLEPRPAPSYGKLPHASYLNNFSISPDAGKPRGRARYAGSRRKEVQVVRKQGACIRCRMLKKPCSGGNDPCDTCAGVETARLWKQPCMRTRLENEFDLYSAGLHSMLQFHQIAQFKDLFTQDPAQLTVFTHLFTNEESAPAFLSFRSGLDPDAVLDLSAIPWNYRASQVIETPPSTMTIIEMENGDPGSKLEGYVRQTSKRLLEREPSTFMRPTLLLAHELYMRKYDPLLGRALALWSFSQVIVDPELDWHFTFDYGGDLSRPRPTAGPFSHHLMLMQLYAQIEKLAALHSKTLCGEIERRLIESRQTAAAPFETFLTAVILLNCIERTAWLFNTWSDAEFLHQSPHVATHTRGAWPLEMPPDFYLDKCDRAANVLNLQVRMRSLTPPSDFDEQGVLRLNLGQNSKRAHTLTARLSSFPESSSPDQSAATTAEGQWLDSVRVHAHTMKRALTAPEWNAKDCRCWDLRFISRLLWPDKTDV